MKPLIRLKKSSWWKKMTRRTSLSTVSKPPFHQHHRMLIRMLLICCFAAMALDFRSFGHHFCMHGHNIKEGSELFFLLRCAHNLINHRIFRRTLFVLCDSCESNTNQVSGPMSETDKSFWRGHHNIRYTTRACRSSLCA